MKTFNHVGAAKPLAELKTQNLRVSSFCEVFKNNKWVGIGTNSQDNISLENAILNKAKKLKLKNS